MGGLENSASLLHIQRSPIYRNIDSLSFHFVLLYLSYFSPPLAGGDEGEGDKFLFTPILTFPPAHWQASRGRVLVKGY